MRQRWQSLHCTQKIASGNLGATVGEAAAVQPNILPAGAGEAAAAPPMPPKPPKTLEPVVAGAEPNKAGAGAGVPPNSEAEAGAAAAAPPKRLPAEVNGVKTGFWFQSRCGAGGLCEVEVGGKVAAAVLGESEVTDGRNRENSSMRSGWPAKRTLIWALTTSTERCSI